MKFPIPFRLLSLFAATSLPLIAQPADPETVSVRFTTYSLAGEIGELSYLQSDGAGTVSISDLRRSDEQRYSGPRELVFFRGGLGSDGKPADVVARAVLNLELKRPLLLFARARDGYVVYQIEDDVDSLPAGSLRFMNLTDVNQDLYIGIGENAEVVKRIVPGGVESYRINDGDIGNLRIRVARSTEAGKPEMLKDMRIFPERLNRYIYFIFQPDLKKPRIEVKMLVEKPGSSANAD